MYAHIITALWRVLQRLLWNEWSENVIPMLSRLSLDKDSDFQKPTEQNALLQVWHCANHWSTILSGQVKECRAALTISCDVSRPQVWPWCHTSLRSAHCDADIADAPRHRVARWGVTNACHTASHRAAWLARNVRRQEAHGQHQASRYVLLMSLSFCKHKWTWLCLLILCVLYFFVWSDGFRPRPLQAGGEG